MLVYLFLCGKKVIHSQLYFHMCISVSQQVKNFDIAVFAALGSFAGISVCWRSSIRSPSTLTSLASEASPSGAVEGNFVMPRVCLYVVGSIYIYKAKMSVCLSVHVSVVNG